MADSTLVFIHIPRTGGSSVRALLSNAYTPHERAFVYEAGDQPDTVSPRDFAALAPDARVRLRMVMGDVSFGIDALLPNGVRYATIVRQPVDRVLSMYYSGPGSTSATGGRLSLTDWLDQQPPGVDNGMVRLITGREDVPYGGCPDGLLTEALEHIAESFDGVFIRGRLARSGDALQRLTGRSIGRPGLENVTQGRPSARDIDAKLRSRLAELNHLDIQLFADVLARAGESPVMLPTARVSPRPAKDRAPRSDRARRSDLAVGDRTLVLMHIAKTGGTALRSSIAHAYKPSERAFVYDPADLRGAVSRDQFAELPEEERNRLRLVMGHFQYGIHDAVGRPCRYVAVIRDPVDRVVSLYYHYLHLRGSWLGGAAREEQRRMKRSAMSIEDWVFSQNRLALDNGMTRNLAARRRVPFGKCPDDLLDEAMEHVDDHFAALLVTDQLSHSLSLLRTITGRPLKEIKRENRNKKRLSLDELDPRLIERFQELNQLDAQLYDIARERLVPLLAGR